jgi:hypothetical protein
MSILELNVSFIPKQYKRAYRDGWKASEENKMLSDNPYCLLSGRSKQFANKWEQGYKDQILSVLRGIN